jgi:hypothetical protein
MGSDRQKGFLPSGPVPIDGFIDVSTTLVQIERHYLYVLGGANEAVTKIRAGHKERLSR